MVSNLIGNFAQWTEVDVRLAVQWNSRIVEWWRFQDNGGRSGKTGHDEHPQEETVQDHGNEFPIFDYLERENQVQVS